MFSPNQAHFPATERNVQEILADNSPLRRLFAVSLSYRQRLIQRSVFDSSLTSPSSAGVDISLLDRPFQPTIFCFHFQPPVIGDFQAADLS